MAVSGVVLEFPQLYSELGLEQPHEAGSNSGSSGRGEGSFDLKAIWNQSSPLPQFSRFLIFLFLLLIWFLIKRRENADQ